ncbi:50S ribosomal protein L24 [Candidatus Saccharibacteria bacterium]|nr:50S ribosomal protein L24 [Candidatus Saccharibacteria bacterium]
MTTHVYKIRLKKGDKVTVLSGKEKGKSGIITVVHPTENKVTVQGINVVKKHVKPTSKNPQGGILEITKPIWVSKVGIVEPTSKKPTRIAYTFDKSGKKTRVFASTKKEIK